MSRFDVGRKGGGTKPGRNVAPRNRVGDRWSGETILKGEAVVIGARFGRPQGAQNQLKGQERTGAKNRERTQAISAG